MHPEIIIGEDQAQDLCDLARSTPMGCIVEVGVYKGGSAWFLAQVAQEQWRELYLYDTFTGIPFQDDGDGHRVGDFSDTTAEAVKEAIPAAHVIKGVFPESIVPMPRIAFAHIDCDQYRSIKACIDHLGPLMVSGGVMVFDDYNCLEAATRAVDENLTGFEVTKRGKAFKRF